LDDDPTGLDVQLHVLGKIRFLEQELGNPNASGIPDSHDACLHQTASKSVDVPADVITS